MHRCQLISLIIKISQFSVSRSTPPRPIIIIAQAHPESRLLLRFCCEMVLYSSVNENRKGGENAFRPKTLKPREATVCYYLIRVYGIIGHSCALRAPSEMRNVVFDLKGK